MFSVQLPQILVRDFTNCASKRFRFDAEVDATESTKKSPFVQSV
jgi:hypothetical protein